MRLEEIKILHIFNSYIFGGLELSTIGYFREFENKFSKIHYFASDGPLSDNFSQLSSAIFHKSVRRIDYNPLHFIHNLLQLLKLIAYEKFNVINYHHRLCLPFILIVRIVFPSVKIIYTSHNRYNDFLSRFLIADNIIAVSKSTANDKFRQSPEKITLIRHGLADKLNVITKAPFDHRIGFVGRFEFEKGIAYLLEMIKLLSSADKRFKFVLIGDGSQKQKIEEFVSVNELKDRIQIYSNLSGKDEIYSNFDILVLPSITLEGFGLVLLEAMSFKIPVIAAETGGIPEIIENEVNGLLVPPKNSNALADAVERLASDSNLRERLTQEGYTTVREKFLFSDTIKNYRSFFKSL